MTEPVLSLKDAELTLSGNAGPVEILHGITRAAVLRFAREAQMSVEERPFTIDEAQSADEAFFTGTAAEIVPIRSVDDRVIGPPGPMTKQLQDVFFSVVRGREPKYDHMLDYVSQR